LDQELMDRVLSLPRTKQFFDWTPDSYFKSVEELRQEIGPELSDDELLLRVLIPGKPAKTGKAEAQSSASAASPVLSGKAAPLDTSHGELAPTAVPPYLGGPREFTVEVDGEVFSVKVSPSGNEIDGAAADQTPSTQPREAPEGAVLCGMAGLVLSIHVDEGDSIAEGDDLAMIETMKMRRQLVSSRSGIVREIWAQEGQMVGDHDVLLVVE
jgi:biotin carboxyl carrier protein